MTSVLLSAVTSGRCRQTRLLLETGSNVHQADECGQTSLLLAVFLQRAKTRERLIRILLKYKAKVSLCDVVGRNALSWACLYGQSKEVALMLRSADLDLDLNHQDHEGQTALFHAATSGNAATVKLMVDALKKYSLSVDVPNVHGLTAMMQAIKLRHDVCASILRNQGGAVAGAQMTSPEDVMETTNRWAVSSHNGPIPRQNESSIPDVPNHRGHLPPILSPAIAQRIKLQESRAYQLATCPVLDSDDEDDLYGSEMSYCSDATLEDLLRDKINNGGASSRYASSQYSTASQRTRCVSYNSSTEAVVDSSSEDELFTDAKSKTITGGPAGGALKSFVASRDLEQMYRIYEDQQSSSYRPTAARPRLHSKPTDSSEENVDPPVKIKETGTPRKNRPHGPGLRPMVLRKQQKRIVLDPVERANAPGQSKNPLTDATMQKLPKIPVETTDQSPKLARKSTQNNWLKNYSMI